MSLFTILILGLASILVIYTILPILGILLRIDTLDVRTLLSSQTTSAMLLSLETATASTAICIVFGLPLAYLIAGSNSKAVQLLRVATATPLAIPPLISGALLLNIYGQNSPIGLMAQHAGFRLTQSTIGIVLAQIYVISPFVVLTASAGIEKVDINYEYASRILGRGSAITFLTVTIPLATNEIVAGISLAWIRAIGEFGANVMVAYNPKTISIQLWEYNALGGLKLVMPGVLIVLVFSFASLAFWLWVMNLRGRRKTSLVSPVEQYHDQD
ncbi:MAG: sulfate ABC transporter permease [Candidatus Nitrosopolaris wilkensis]|nr:MAG: sulfate ABC transporter permease [Candidatus Nitrosopolaris wilkensis]